MSICNVPKLLRNLASPARDKDHDAIKVMVIGDSISHGREGDWTWRYRIWQWFKEHEVAVRFVGPYKGTVPPDEPRPPRPPPLADEPPVPPPPLRTDGGYSAAVDSKFLSNSYHFAASGQQAFYAKDLVAEQVAAYQPDLCLVELGFNDLAWRQCGPVELIASIKHLVDQARSARPDVKFAIADVPQRTDLPGREDLPIATALYNEMLARSIPSWSSEKSPIALVRFCENYSCGGTNSDAAYDGLHPNALGDYQLAQAFSRTLVSAYSLGHTPLVVPKHIPSRPLPTPAKLKAVPSPSGIIVTWKAVYGALGYDLEHRRVPDKDWTCTSVNCNRYYWQPLPMYRKVECRVRASGGDSVKSPWSEVVSAIANPETAPPPRNMATHATPTGFTITWDPPTPPFAGEIDRYGITYFDSDEPGVFPCAVGAKGDNAEVTGLTPGHRHYITMETWTTVGGGMPASAHAVIVGQGTPSALAYLHAKAIDKLTVELSWPKVLGAAGYDVWMRREKSIRERLNLNAPMIGPLRDPIAYDEEPGMVKMTLRGMEPSVWDWEFAVNAYNGDDASELSAWVTPPP